MPEQIVQLAVDSGSGKKLRQWEETVGANTVYQDTFIPRKGQCYAVYSTDIVPTATMIYLTLLNASGSGKVIVIRTAVHWNNLAAVNTGGGGAIIEYTRITAVSGGTAITPISIDPGNAAVPAQITATSNPTSVTADTGQPVFFAYNTSTRDDRGIATTTSTSGNQAAWLCLEEISPLNPTNESQQYVTLSEGKGLAIRTPSGGTTAGKMSSFILFELI